MSLSKLKSTLYDARFIKSIEILNAHDQLKAIYMVRLYSGFGLASAKKYIRKINRFKAKMRNPIQY
jgi:hypothetical protein